MPELTAEQAEARAEKKGEEKAADARAVVAEQVRELIIESGSTGSAALLARRIDQLLVAVRSGDVFLARGAAMELSRASALYAVRMDLRQGA